MGNDECINDRAKYLEVNEKTQEKINEIRRLFSEIYTFCDIKLKPSRETSLTYTKLEEAQFWAIKGITREEQ